LIEAEPAGDKDLEAMVTDAFKDAAGEWYYALSDLVVADSVPYQNFCIVEDKQQRNLETHYDETSCLKKLKKSETSYCLISRGSVFYQKCELSLENENCKQIGYNKVVKLGGK